MDFLEFTITAFLADHLASREEQAEACSRLEEEMADLRSEIERLKDEKKD